MEAGALKFCRRRVFQWHAIRAPQPSADMISGIFLLRAESDQGAPPDYLGTAFLVTSRLALTAFHCVKDPNTPDLPIPNVRLDGDAAPPDADGNVPAARVIDFDARIDVAILELDVEARPEVTPFVLRTEAFDDDSIRISGFPGAVSPAVSPMLLPGRITRVRGLYPIDGTECIQLDIPAASTMPLNGFSGGPVLDEGRAIGLVALEVPDEDTARAMGNAVFAVSIQSVVDRFPRFRTLVEPTKREHLQATARRWGQHELSRRVNEQPGRDILINSQALTDFDLFVGHDWRRDCRKEAQRLCDLLGTKRQYTSLAVRIRALDWNTSFETLWTDLRALDFGHLVEELRHLRTSIAINDNASADAGHDLDRCLASARYLRDEAERPRFRHCYAIVGGWGSGRTRLLVECGRRLLEQGHVLAFVGSEMRGDLTREVLLQAGQVFGTTPESLADTARRLRTLLDAQLFVLVDDTDVLASRHGSFVGDLRSAIAESTIDPSIRWILATDETRFDVLCSATDPWFWQRYGYIDGLPELGGWIDLDVADAEEELGFALIEHFADAEEHRALQEFRADAAAFDYERRQLTKPLPAWLSIETGSSARGARVTNVNRDAVVAAYWQRRRDTLVDGSIGPHELEQAVTILAQRFVEYGYALYLDEVTKLIEATATMPALRDGRGAERVISILRTGGLIACEFIGDPEVVLQRCSLYPRFELFWGYRIARTVLAQIRSDPEAAAALFSAIRPWALRAGAGDRLGESVTAFFLLLESTTAGAPVEPTIWQRWLDDPEVPDHPLMLAAAGAPNEVQNALAKSFQRTKPAVDTKRGLFALLRLVALAATPDWPAFTRLNLVRSHYRDVRANGLSSYLGYAIATLAEREELCDAHNYKAFLHSLSGCEDADVAPAAAEAAVRAGRQIFEDDDAAWLRSLMRYLKGSSDPRTPDEFPRRPSDSADISEGSDGLVYFWQRLIHAGCRELVRRRGLDAFDTFAGVRWLVARRAGIAPYVATRMQIEANVAIGTLFPDDARPSRLVARYVELVNALIDGRAMADIPRVEQREIAFFLIRHSQVTHRAPAVVVSPVLRPALKVLGADDELRQRLGQWLTATCQANARR